MQFEWDEEKRRANLKKHDVDFRDIPSVFHHPHLSYSSPRGEEPRRVAVGPLHSPEERPQRWSGPLVAVVYIRKATQYRIISARRARTNERQAYEDIFG